MVCNVFPRPYTESGIMRLRMRGGGSWGMGHSERVSIYEIMYEVVVEEVGEWGRYPVTLAMNYI